MKCVTECEELTAEIEVIPEETVVSDCIEEEVLVYISGWLIRQIKADPLLSSCSRWEEVLIYVNHSDHSYAASPDVSHLFVKRKRYTDQANVIEPSRVLHETILRMEDKLKESVAEHWAGSSLCKTLRQEVEDSGAFSLLTATHPEHALALQKKNTGQIYNVQDRGTVKAGQQEGPGGQHKGQKKIKVLHRLDLVLRLPAAGMNVHGRSNRQLCPHLGWRFSSVGRASAPCTEANSPLQQLPICPGASVNK